MVKHYVKLLSPLFYISRREVKTGRGILPGFLILFFLMGWNVSSGQLIAGWDFQTTTNGGTATAAATNTPKAYVANVGAGNMYLDGTNSSSNWLQASELSAFGGSALNAGGSTGLSTTTSGASSLALLGGTGGTAANGKSIVFTFSMAGKQNLIVSYATQKTSTGFATQTWEYSTNGTTWASVGTITTIPTSFAVQTLPTVTGLNNITTAYLRLTVTGASAASGNNRLDNIQLNASAIPVGGPSVTIADNGTQITAGAVNQGTANVVLNKIQLTVADAAASLTGMKVTTAGTYASSDVSNLRAIYSADATLDVGDTTLSTITTPGTAGEKTFSSFTTQSIAIGTGYIFITADVSATAVHNNTISVNAITSSQLTITNATYSSPTNTAGGAQTFKDVTAPLATTYNPANGAINVAIGSNLSVTFNENVKAGTTGTIKIYDSTNTLFESFNFNSARVTFSGATATINPTLDLAYQTNYYVTIDSGAVSDSHDVPFAGFSTNATWSFTTVLQPPANDLCANPSPLTVGATSSGQTLIGSTSNLGSNDVWYTFSPSCSGTHSILVNFTEGEDVDFEVYASCPASTSEKLTLTNNNVGFDSRSADFAGATVGTTYYLRVIDAGGNSSTFSVLVSTTVTPSVALANTGTPAAGNIAAGSNNVVLFGFTLTPSACNTPFTFTGANITTGGDAAATDLSNFRLIVDSANFGIADAGEIAASIGTATFTNGNPLTFSSLAQNLTAGVSTHYLLIADVNSAAGNGKTFTASLSSADVAAGTVTGSASGNTKTITSTSILIADNTQVTDGNILRGTNNTIVSKAKLTVSGQTASVTQINFVTAGSAGAYVQSDIATNGFKLWRSASSGVLDTNTDTLIGSVSSTKGGTATNADNLSFNISENLAVGDYYYWLTVDVLSTATPSHTITVNGLTNASVTSAGTTILGSTSTSGAQTIISPTLTIANNTQITTQNLLVSSTANIISKAQFTPSVSNVTVTGINFVTAGTYTNADIAANGFKLWVTTSNIFAATTAFGTSQSSATGNGETIAFSDNQTLSVGTTYYFWLTADVSASATLGHAIVVNGLTTSNVTASTVGVFLTGNTSATGNQTITDNAPSLGTTSASVDAPFSITLSPDNANYRGAITSVKIGATSLVFTTSAGNITLDPANPGNTLLRTPGNKTIDIIAANYSAAQVTQTMTVGATAKLALGLPALVPPTTNGGLFATQPTVSYRDKYDNPTTSTATITATKFDGGSWTLGGTTSITPAAATGSVTFANLTATSAALVNNAQIRFSLNGVPGSTPVDSATFTILAPDFISLATFGTTVTENFDTLATSGTSSATPTGWSFLETLSNANTVYTAGTGSGTGGDTYSFGVAGTNPATDRAFGMLRSGSLASTIGAKFKNTTGSTINSLTITYRGEEWRLGANGGRQDKLDFQYSTDATSIATGTATWTDVDELDFSTPFTTTTGALDGNATANRASKSSIISVNIPNGSTFFIRFNDFDVSGADDALAVDDFNITPCQAPNAGTNGTLTVCAGTTPTNAELFAQLGGSPQAGGTWSPPVSGVYTYTVTSTAPCSGTATATVTVTTQPAANAGNDGVYTICAGTNITLAQLQAAITGEDAGGTWSPALAGAGTYTYTVAATSPCTAPDTSVVVVTEVSCQAAQLSNCGNTPVLTSVNTRIFAGNTVTQATKYRYRVAVSTAPLTYFYAETTYPSFRLTDVVGLTPTYGTTYNVEIQNEFLLSGNTVASAYGPLCTVTTQAATNITVPTNQCGQTLAAVNSKIYVNGVTGATSYTYRVAKQSAPTTYSYIDSPYSNFRLTNAPTSGNVAIEHNTVYLVAVSVTTSNGSSNFNGECMITTPAGPMTTLQASQCGDDETPYVIPTKSTKVYAEGLVSGATYTFKLEQYEGSELVDTNYATSPINYFDCNMFTGENALLPSTNYHVYVAINYYGQGEFDHDCVIRTPAALKHEEMVKDDFKAMAYPNPFADNFMIDVKSASESVVGLKVYDMIGRLVDQKEVRVSDLETTTIGHNYPSGVYNVVVSQENSIQTVRVVKR